MIVSFDKQIDCAELCKIIQEVINRHMKTTGLPVQAISIKVVDVLDSVVHIPKLEHKNEDYNQS